MPDDCRRNGSEIIASAAGAQQWRRQVVRAMMIALRVMRVMRVMRALRALPRRGT
jgi:hypothetical protein